MKDFDRFDQRLRQALYSNLEPSIELNEKILNQLKENEKMKSVHKKKIVYTINCSYSCLNDVGNRLCSLAIA